MALANSITISDFQNKLNFIYSDVNSLRKPEYVYSYLFRNTSYLSRSVLRSGDVKNYFLKTYSWLFSFSNLLKVDVELAFRKKYPNVCPYCLSKPCSCVQNHKTPSSDLPAYKIREELEDKHNTDMGFFNGDKFSIDVAVRRISDIYPANQSIWSVYGSFYHFTRIFEELGEIHEAFTTYQKDATRKKNLEEEIADFTAWLLSAWKIQFPDKSLQDSLNDYYMNGCPVCEHDKCDCIDYSDRHESVVNSQDLLVLKREIQNLKTNVNDKQNELNELLKSIDDAIVTKSTSDAKRVVTQTKSTLEDISKASDSIVTIGENAGKVMSILAGVSTIISKFAWNN